MKRVIFPILGGIGNQLFQLSALAGLSPEYERVVDSTLFSDSPNFSKLGPNDLDISQTLKFIEFQRAQHLSRRLMGLLLRYSFFESQGAIRRSVYSILLRTTEVVLAKRYSSKVSLIVLSETGYRNICISENSNAVVILGYCQSYKYHSSIDTLQKLFRCQSSVIDRVGFSPTELAKIEVPLVVHIRRGDYLLNPQLGLLSKQYYSGNIGHILKETQAKSIWLFSNDLESPLEFIPEQFWSQTRVMNFDNISDLEALEMMKLGHAFLIANSSFSWWAAYLSNADSRNIYVPEPWFSELPTPADLFPFDWRRLRSHFVSAEEDV
jgi:hypothetical protein